VVARAPIGEEYLGKSEDQLESKELDGCSVPREGREPTITGNQGGVQLLRKHDIRGGVGREIVAELPDARQQNRWGYRVTRRSRRSRTVSSARVPEMIPLVDGETERRSRRENTCCSLL